jgi:hypothetical protein
MEIGIHFGAMAPPLKEQLKEFNLDDNSLEHFQKDAEAIVRLAIRGIIPDSVKSSANKRLLKNIVRKIEATSPPQPQGVKE